MKNTAYILFILCFIACKQNTEPVTKTAPTQKDRQITKEVAVDLNETTTSIATDFKSVESEMIYLAYLDLKGVLVNTDAKEAAEIASEFKKALATADAGNDDIQNLKISLDNIASSQDIDAQRVAFEAVSRQVEAIVDDELVSGEIIKQFCPMAFDGKGAYWLSDSKEIRNPYYGDKMLKCGVVDKEIN